MQEIINLKAIGSLTFEEHLRTKESNSPESTLQLPKLSKSVKNGGRN